MIFIGLINWGKRFFIGVIGVRAKFPSLFGAKLLSDLERFDTER
jgi:hypothetical protein